MLGSACSFDKPSQIGEVVMIRHVLSSATGLAVTSSRFAKGTG